MSTILKLAGNKTAIMPELKKHLPAGPRLVEPFAGSCAVMMETDYPSYLVADINPDLINLYKKVAADCESFISRARVLFEIANREVAYYNIRQEFNYSTEITDFMKAAYSALFDHGLASKSDQRFASIRSTGNLTFSTAF